MQLKNCLLPINLLYSFLFESCSYYADIIVFNRLDDTCMVKFTANNTFNINYQPTFQTLFHDYETMLYDSFSYDCQGRQLPLGLYALLSKSCNTLKSLSLSHLPEGCRICIYDLFRKFDFKQYSVLEELELSRKYTDECYIQLASTVSLPVNVKMLTLYGIGLASVPQALTTFHTLTHLNIGNNVITCIDNLTSGNIQQSLTVLDVSNNSLAFIPETIGKLTSLIVLDLSHNCIKNSLPESLATISHLSELSLAWNRIDKVSVGSLMSLQQLHSIDLSYNKLKTISQQLFFHPSLKFLNLSGNLGLEILTDSSESQIAEDADQSASPESSLRELDVSSIALSLLPSFFQKLHHLCILRCNDNSLTNIDVIFDLRQLETASFACNNITEYSQIYSKICESSESKLKSLDLSYNNTGEIKNVHEDEVFYIKDTLVLQHYKKGVHCQPKLILGSLERTAARPKRSHWLCIHS